MQWEVIAVLWKNDMYFKKEHCFCVGSAQNTWCEEPLGFLLGSFREQDVCGIYTAYAFMHLCLLLLHLSLKGFPHSILGVGTSTKS